MKIELTFNGSTYSADLDKGHDLSLPVGRANEGSAYGIPNSEIRIYRDGGFVGDVSAGGSCNVREIRLNPHGNGTHTECVGHVSKEYRTLSETIQKSHFIAELVSIETQVAIRAEDLKKARKHTSTEALIIRSLPNTLDKRSKNWLGTEPPYMSNEAMALLVEWGINHLLLDLPSVDSETDPHLQSHKVFWNYPSEKYSIRTITELIYVNDAIEDGLYLLNLQCAPIELDAVPSKPIIYSLR